MLFDFDELQMQFYAANECYKEQLRRFKANMAALEDVRDWSYDEGFRERLTEAETAIRETLSRIENAQ